MANLKFNQLIDQINKQDSVTRFLDKQKDLRHESLLEAMVIWNNETEFRLLTQTKDNLSVKCIVPSIGEFTMRFKKDEFFGFVFTEVIY